MLRLINKKLDIKYGIQLRITIYSRAIVEIASNNPLFSLVFSSFHVLFFCPGAWLSNLFWAWFFFAFFWVSEQAAVFFVTGWGHPPCFFPGFYNFVLWSPVHRFLKFSDHWEPIDHFWFFPAGWIWEYQILNGLLWKLYWHFDRRLPGPVWPGIEFLILEYLSYRVFQTCRFNMDRRLCLSVIYKKGPIVFILERYFSNNPLVLLLVPLCHWHLHWVKKNYF